MLIEPARVRELARTRVLSVTIFVTEQCNLRCSYCYEDFQRGVISPHVASGLKTFLVNAVRAGRPLYLSWFGGEPLLALDSVLDISAAVMDAGIENDVPVSGHATTNATRLTVDVLRRLSEVGVRDFQVTIDGTPEVHDERRVRSGGQGTYAQIVRNLVAAHESSIPFSMTLRIHYDGRSISRLPEVARNVVAFAAFDQRFRVLVRSLSRLGGRSDSNIMPVSRREAAAAEEAFAAVIRAGGLECDGQHLGKVADSANVCYASLPQSLVIRSDGVVMKCTVAVNDVRNAVGSISPEGNLVIDNDRLQPWLRGLYSGRLDELECPLRGMASETVPTATSRSLPLTVV